MQQRFCKYVSVLPHVRCDERQSLAARHVTCQLYVGHDGKHAAAILRDGVRLLRLWATGRKSAESDFTSSMAASLAWAPGCPLPVVAEPLAPAPALRVVTESAPMTSPPAGDLHIA